MPEVGDEAFVWTWMDVDTPQAKAMADRLIAEYGEDLDVPMEIPAATFAIGA